MCIRMHCDPVCTSAREEGDNNRGRLLHSADWLIEMPALIKMQNALYSNHEDFNGIQMEHIGLLAFFLL